MSCGNEPVLDHEERKELKIRLSADLYRKLKHIAVDYDISLTDLIVDVIIKYWMENGM